MTMRTYIDTFVKADTAIEVSDLRVKVGGGDGAGYVNLFLPRNPADRRTFLTRLAAEATKAANLTATSDEVLS